MQFKSEKMLDVEEYVDQFIKAYQRPPTYDMISKEFKIAKNSAYSRCGKFRHKMISRKKWKTSEIEFVQNNPWKFTEKELAEKFNVSPRAIKKLKERIRKWNTKTF